MLPEINYEKKKLNLSHWNYFSYGIMNFLFFFGSSLFLFYAIHFTNWFTRNLDDPTGARIQVNGLSIIFFIAGCYCAYRVLNMGKLAVIESDLPISKKAEIIKNLEPIYDWVSVNQTKHTNHFSFIYGYSYQFYKNALLIDVNIFIDEKGFYIHVIDTARVSPFDVFGIYPKLRNKIRDSIETQSVDAK
jgi:hypothetical protein